jgi:hypothetical protein
MTGQLAAIQRDPLARKFVSMSAAIVPLPGAKFAVGAPAKSLIVTKTL